MSFCGLGTQGCSGSFHRLNQGEEASPEPLNLMLLDSPHTSPIPKGPCEPEELPPMSPHLLLSLQQTDTWSLKHWPALPGMGTAGIGRETLAQATLQILFQTCPASLRPSSLESCFLLGWIRMPGPMHGPAHALVPVPGSPNSLLSTDSL
ncbi:hypothetical protein PAL_GLEAN10005428 [Pteropus alecto]|uniref:Uncharacterized protein n=1 Tax=Pteropus alecto TaxID=9402 RepID=L5JTM3_PTEAL|nr:hypothetical protein PAL_GLEAN10005428 [Pteropus alecto]